MDASIGVTHFTSAAIVVYLTNRLKAAKWFPLVQQDKARLNRIFSVLVAFVVSIGIHYTWNSDSRVLAIAVPTIPQLALGVWHWLNQYAMQETLYQVIPQKANGLVPKAQ